MLSAVAEEVTQLLKKRRHLGHANLVFRIVEGLHSEVNEGLLVHYVASVLVGVTPVEHDNQGRRVVSDVEQVTQLVLLVSIDLNAS